MVTEHRPTLHDVGRAAGVSHQTVSRVLSGRRSAEDDVRHRVLAAAESVGYRPNALARALVTSRSGTIGVLAPVSAAPGVQRRIVAVELAARESGLAVLLTTADPDDAGTLRAGLDRLLSHGVEGVVVVLAHEVALAAPGSGTAAVPHVLLASEDVRMLGSGSDRRTGPDGGWGARQAVRHLVELGHERVLHLAGPAGWIASAVRRTAYIEEIRSAGLTPLPSPEVGWNARDGYEAGRRLLPGRNFTAVFAVNDHVAIGWLHACREQGVPVPDELSVVGYDDLPESAHVAPPLTTVHRDEQALGRRAVDLLLRAGDALDADPAPPSLVVRDSTAPPHRGR